MEHHAQDVQRKLEARFLAAYDEYGKAIFRHILLRVSDRAAAEDLASETFMKTWQYLRERNMVGNFKSFLYRVANNLVIDYYRSGRKERVSLEEVLEEGAEPPSQKSVETEGALRADYARARRAMQKLPESYRQMLVYRYVDELGVKEVQKITGKSAMNIYTTTHRALKALRDCLDEPES